MEKIRVEKKQVQKEKFDLQKENDKIKEEIAEAKKKAIKTSGNLSSTATQVCYLPTNLNVKKEICLFSPDSETTPTTTFNTVIFLLKAFLRN